MRKRKLANNKMAYKDKHGITEIKSGNFHNISISYEMEDEHRVPMLLFTPDMKNTGLHYHIEFSKEEAAELRNWLDEFLNK